MDKSYKTNCTHSVFRTIETHASLPQQIIKKKNSIIKRFYIDSSLLDRTVQSGKPAIM